MSKLREGWIDPEDLYERCPEYPINGYIHVCEVMPQFETEPLFSAEDFFESAHCVKCQEWAAEEANAKIREWNERHSAELARLREENRALLAENEKLADEKQELEIEKNSFEQDNKGLRAGMEQARKWVSLIFMHHRDCKMEIGDSDSRCTCNVKKARAWLAKHFPEGERG